MTSEWFWDILKQDTNKLNVAPELQPAEAPLVSWWVSPSQALQKILEEMAQLLKPCEASLVVSSKYFRRSEAVKKTRPFTGRGVL